MSTDDQYVTIRLPRYDWVLIVSFVEDMCGRPRDEIEMLTGATELGVCGGCRGLGSHSPRCDTQPGSMWRRFADRAEALGDEIGSNDTAAANAAYALAGRLTQRADTTR